MIARLPIKANPSKGGDAKPGNLKDQTDFLGNAVGVSRFRFGIRILRGDHRVGDDN
jgi:hypothetical protein